MRKGGEKGKRKEKYWVKHREKIEKFQGHLILYTRVRVRTLTHSPTHSTTHYPLTHHPLTHSLLTHSLLTHPPTHPPTHLSVFKNKQPGVVLSPWRETHVVHLISILTHTKIEPCRRTEKLKPKVSSQAIKLTAPMLREGRGRAK